MYEMNGGCVKIGALIPWPMLHFAVLPDPVPGPAILVDAAPCFHPLARSLRRRKLRIVRFRLRRKFTRFAAPPFPTKTASLGFGGVPDDEIVANFPGKISGRTVIQFSSRRKQ